MILPMFDVHFPFSGNPSKTSMFHVHFFLLLIIRQILKCIMYVFISLVISQILKMFDVYFPFSVIPTKT